MKIEDIFKKVAATIEESCGISADEIKPGDSLFNHLGIDSIDFVDILFELETEFEVELNVKDIRQMASQKLGGKPYEINGMITPDAVEVLREFLTDFDPSEYTDGLSIHQMSQLISVHTLCKMVEHKVLELETES